MNDIQSILIYLKMINWIVAKICIKLGAAFIFLERISVYTKLIEEGDANIDANIKLNMLIYFE